jgi:hypothetical protein
VTRFNEPRSLASPIEIPETQFPCCVGGVKCCLHDGMYFSLRRWCGSYTQLVVTHFQQSNLVLTCSRTSVHHFCIYGRCRFASPCIIVKQCKHYSNIHAGLSKPEQTRRIRLFSIPSQELTPNRITGAQQNPSQYT